MTQHARARAGEISNFTGIDSDYEVPESPELRIDTTKMSAEEASERIFSYLRAEGYLEAPGFMDGAGI